MRICGCLAFAIVFLLAVGAGAQPVCAPDDVQATASGDTISVQHRNAERNCCSTLTLVVHQENFVVDFLEGEAEPWCRCLCCFDMRHEAWGFAPGHYTVRVWDETGSTLYGEDEVDVTAGGSGVLILGQLQPGDCTVRAAPQTWSAVRALYR